MLQFHGQKCVGLDSDGYWEKETALAAELFMTTSKKCVNISREIQSNSDSD